MRTYTVKAGELGKASIPCAIIGISDKQTDGPMLKAIEKASKGAIKRLIKRGDISTASGTTTLITDLAGTKIERLLVVGLGDGSPDQLTASFQSAAAQLKKIAAKSALVVMENITSQDRDAKWVTAKFIECVEDALYQYVAMKGTGKPKAPALSKVQFAAQSEDAGAIRAGLKLGVALSKGKNATRDLGNAPSNVCTPTYLASEAKKLARAYPSLTTTVLEEKQMAKLGMGAFLSVSKGSDEPGKMVIMHYKGASASKQPHVIVGKGITFDTGGISLKPGGGMWEMIYDMCGAATVFGTMQTLCELAPKLNVIGVMAAAENMPSGGASKPGDIVTTMSGQTVEILNTDAEGRLVLCDALTYVERFKPASVVDIATLTGACIVALGSQASAVFANDDALAKSLIDAGERTRDRAWQLPIWDGYQKQINSAFADMQNIGGKEAGSITAACFLARFAKKYPWAHMDIAGTSFKWAGLNKGATARPVGLLTDYLLSQK